MLKAASFCRGRASVALAALLSCLMMAGGCATGTAAAGPAVAAAPVNLDLPRDFREALARQQGLADELAAGLAGGGAGGGAAASASQAALGSYAEAMRQSNDRLTSILADEIIKLQAEGPPIRRINAWTAVRAIVNYADAEKLRALEGPGPLSARLDAYYARAVAAAEPQRLRHLLHVEPAALAGLLERALKTERSENVRYVAAAVVEKVAAMARR